MNNQNILRLFFWLLLGAVLAISIMPAEDAPAVFANDKFNHVLAFFTLSFMARILWSRTDATILFGMLSVFGGGIELLQLSMGFGRDADGLDFATDIVALAVGVLSGKIFHSWKGKGTITEGPQRPRIFGAVKDPYCSPQGAPISSHLASTLLVDAYVAGIIPMRGQRTGSCVSANERQRRNRLAQRRNDPHQRHNHNRQQQGYH